MQQRSEPRRRIRSHSWRDMTIEVERGLDVVVPKALTHGLDVDSGLANRDLLWQLSYNLA